jgi:hypothetical protein
MDTGRRISAASLKPYDDSMWENWSLYDNMPYSWDPELNPEKRLAFESGNIIKGYRCLIKDQPYEVKH